MTYKLVKNSDGKLANVIQKLPETTFIPCNEENERYQEYLTWKKNGGVPQDAD
tara:strand:+ start:1996 stop:2154 length:159 start_codon:yes stop_codon:yes gene_type:complete